MCKATDKRERIYKVVFTFDFFLMFFLVHGNWSAWSGYTACSLTCGNGTKSRNRTCNNPVPMYGGLLCNLTDGTNELEETETMGCYEAHCPG